MIIFRLITKIKHKCNQIKLNYIVICTNNKRMTHQFVQRHQQAKPFHHKYAIIY